MVAQVISGNSYHLTINRNGQIKSIGVKIIGCHRRGGFVAVNKINNRRMRILNGRRLSIPQCVYNRPHRDIPSDGLPELIDSILSPRSSELPNILLGVKIRK